MSTLIQKSLAHGWALVPIAHNQKDQCPKPFTFVPVGHAVGWLEVDVWVLNRKENVEGGSHAERP